MTTTASEPAATAVFKDLLAFKRDTRRRL
jgi:hypothetical protein